MQHSLTPPKYKRLKYVSQQTALELMEFQFPLLHGLYLRNTAEKQERIIGKLLMEPSSSDGEGFVYGFRQQSQYRSNPTPSAESPHYDIKMGKTIDQTPENRIHQWEKDDQHKYVQIFTMRSQTNSKLQSLVHLFFAYARKEKIINNKRRIEWFTFEEPVPNAILVGMIDLLIERVHEINRKNQEAREKQSLLSSAANFPNDHKGSILSTLIKNSSRDSSFPEINLQSLTQQILQEGKKVHVTDYNVLLFGNKSSGKTTLNYVLSGCQLAAVKKAVPLAYIRSSAQHSSSNLHLEVKQHSGFSRQVTEIRAYNEIFPGRTLLENKQIQNIITDSFLEWNAVYSTRRLSVPFLLIKEDDFFSYEMLGLKKILSEYLKMFQNSKKSNIHRLNRTQSEFERHQKYQNHPQSQSEIFLYIIITHATPQTKDNKQKPNSISSMFKYDKTEKYFKQYLRETQSQYLSEDLIALLISHTKFFFFQKPSEEGSFEENPNSLYQEITQTLRSLFSKSQQCRQNDFSSISPQIEYRKSVFLHTQSVQGSKDNVCQNKEKETNRQSTQIEQQGAETKRVNLISPFMAFFKETIEKLCPLMDSILVRSFKSSLKAIDCKKSVDQEPLTSPEISEQIWGSSEQDFEVITDLMLCSKKSKFLHGISTAIHKMTSTCQQSQIYRSLKNLCQVLAIRKSNDTKQYIPKKEEAGSHCEDQQQILLFLYTFCECMYRQHYHTAFIDDRKNSVSPSSSSPMLLNVNYDLKGAEGQKPSLQSSKDSLYNNHFSPYHQPIPYMQNSMIFDGLEDAVSEIQSDIKEICDYILNSNFKVKLQKCVGGIVDRELSKNDDSLISNGEINSSVVGSEKGSTKQFINSLQLMLTLVVEFHSSSSTEQNSQSFETFFVEILNQIMTCLQEQSLDRGRQRSIRQLRQIIQMTQIFEKVKLSHKINISSVQSRVKEAIFVATKGKLTIVVKTEQQSQNTSTQNLKHGDAGKKDKRNDSKPERPLNHKKQGKIINSKKSDPNKQKLLQEYIKNQQSQKREQQRVARTEPNGTHQNSNLRNSLSNKGEEASHRRPGEEEKPPEFKDQRSTDRRNLSNNSTLRQEWVSEEYSRLSLEQVGSKQFQEIKYPDISEDQTSRQLLDETIFSQQSEEQFSSHQNDRKQKCESSFIEEDSKYFVFPEEKPQRLELQRFQRENRYDKNNSFEVDDLPQAEQDVVRGFKSLKIHESSESSSHKQSVPHQLEYKEEESLYFTSEPGSNKKETKLARKQSSISQPVARYHQDVPEEIYSANSMEYALIQSQMFSPLSSKAGKSNYGNKKLPIQVDREQLQNMVNTLESTRAYKTKEDLSDGNHQDTDGIRMGLNHHVFNSSSFKQLEKSMQAVIRQQNSARFAPLMFNFSQGTFKFDESSPICLRNSLILFAKSVKIEKPTKIDYKVPNREKNQPSKINFLVIAEEYENLQRLQIRLKKNSVRVCFLKLKSRNSKFSEKVNLGYEAQKLDIHKEYNILDEWLKDMKKDELIDLFCQRVIEP